MTDLRIYFACLAAYNNGVLHGTWIDVEDKNADDIQAEINAMLASSPIPDAEEFAIHDSEGFPAGVIGEYTPIKDIVAVAEAIEEHGDVFVAALSYWSDVETALEACKNAFYRAYDSPEDWAVEFLEDTGSLAEVPKHLRNYIDFEAYARNAQLGGDMVFVDHDGMVYVFNSTW